MIWLWDWICEIGIHFISRWEDDAFGYKGTCGHCGKEVLR